MMYLSAFNILERRNAVFGSVNGHVGIIGIVLGHGLEYTAGGWEESCPAVLVAVHFLFKLDFFVFEPFGQLVKGQHGVRKALIMLGLILFGNTGSHKYNFGIRITPFYVLTVRLHGRKNIGQKIKRFWKIFLNKKIDRVTAGGNNNVPGSLVYHTLIFGLDNGGTHRRLLHIIKAQFLKRLTHGADTHTLIICHKRRGKTDYYRFLSLHEYPDLFGLVHNLLGILRADHKALTAKDTLVSYNIGLVSRKSNGLYGTVPNTFITVFTV